MYIYQNGKLYVQKGKKLVGVDINLGKPSLVKDCTDTLCNKYKLLTPIEVKAKFGTYGVVNYKFPRPDPEPEKVSRAVNKDDPDRKAKTTSTRGRKRK